MTFDDCPTYADVSRGEGHNREARREEEEAQTWKHDGETTADELAIYIKFYGRALCRECILPQ